MRNMIWLMIETVDAATKKNFVNNNKLCVI